MKVEPQSFLTLSAHVCPHFLNMPTQISLNTLKLHNERVDELLKQVEDHFKWQPVHPKESIESIMYRAGQASVVEYIKNIITEDE